MGYLYLIKCDKYHKIGVATDMGLRLASLQTGNPYTLEVVCYYEFDKPQTVETALHQKFSNKRVSGEWFELSSEDIYAFHKIAEMLNGKIIKQKVVVTEEDEVGAEILGEENDKSPIRERIEELLKNGWRLELNGADNYKGKYVIARRGSGKNREYVRIGNFVPEIEPYLKKRKGKGRYNHGRKKEGL